MSIKAIPAFLAFFIWEICKLSSSLELCTCPHPRLEEGFSFRFLYVCPSFMCITKHCFLREAFSDPLLYSSPSPHQCHFLLPSALSTCNLNFSQSNYSSLILYSLYSCLLSVLDLECKSRAKVPDDSIFQASRTMTDSRDLIIFLN